MTSAYLSRPRRALAEVLALRVEPGDRVAHPTFGSGVVSMLLTPAERDSGQPVEAMVRFDDGERRLVTAARLRKVT